MKTSEEIHEIASALNEAQSVMTCAVKGSKNPFFKSSYADLAAVMQAISKPFAENDLSFVQSPGFDGKNVTVTTRIMHSSGQWIEGTCVLPPTKNDAQGYGSAITYAKRYGLQAMAGVPSADDDGNAAVKHAPTVLEQINSSMVRSDLTTLWGVMNKQEQAAHEAEFKTRMTEIEAEN